ncbi:MAG: SLC13 family permease [Pseudomonadales bacterium]|nr:SLC13 family permease [Pseudomonadales bacterium]
MFGIETDILLVLSILGISLVLFITEQVRMDVVALMVLCALALTGLVSPSDAFSGFSNAAVITVWAMFILSEGLSRAGIADILGRSVLRIAGRGEARMIAVIMLVSGALSGFMNNIGVAALMLPVVVDVARRSDIPAPRLLMPLAYGTLLGGLTTMVGTPPNLLVSGALKDAGLQPFGLFDFTPLGVIILLVGTAFVALIGRHLLPRTTVQKDEDGSRRNLRDQYGLRERMFMVRVPPDALAAGRTIQEVGLTRSAGLIIIALMRNSETMTLPGSSTRLQAGDLMLVQGRTERFEALRKWGELTIERESPILKERISEELEIRELHIAEESSLIGEPVRHREFRDRYSINVLAVRRGTEVWRTNLGAVPLHAGDHLLVQCNPDNAAALEKSAEFDAAAKVSNEDLLQLYELEDRVFVIHVPKESELEGLSLSETRLADAFDFRLLAVMRESELQVMPGSDVTVMGGDLIFVQGRPEDVDVLRGLQELRVQYDPSSHLDVFESDALQMVEATLHPHSSLSGKSVAELDLRGRYQLELIAIWRNGRPYRSDLGAMKLELGDAVLVVGPRERLVTFERDPEFIVLTPLTSTALDTSKAPMAGFIMLAVVSVVLLEWLPIAIAAVSGATAMVLTGCLSMENAYRAIEWRSIFLIAGMLPLGVAMTDTGAATFVADAVMSSLGDYGPWAVLLGLYGVTALATMIVPTAALVVLMAPIVLTASAEIGMSPYPAMMAVAIAASASFTSPISHPANVLVMGPGGYRFVDYLKLGVPLTLVVFGVVYLLLPVFWPLS